MNKIIVAKIVAGLSIIFGISAIFGLYYNNTFLVSVYPDWVKIKFATAICFIFSGIILFFLELKNDKNSLTRQVVLIFFPLLITLIMLSMFFGSVIGFQTGLENINFIDVHETNTLIFQGRPSLATMIAFILISYIGFSSSLVHRLKKCISVLSMIVVFIGTVGVIGYVLKQPALYFEIKGISNAIAFHTSIMFILSGIAIFLTWKDDKTKYYEKDKLANM